MSPEILLAGTQLVNTLLQRALGVSTHIANGTLTQQYLDDLEAHDDAARAAQLEARDRARTEGR